MHLGCQFVSSASSLNLHGLHDRVQLFYLTGSVISGDAKNNLKLQSVAAYLCYSVHANKRPFTKILRNSIIPALQNFVLVLVICGLFNNIVSKLRLIRWFMNNAFERI